MGVVGSGTALSYNVRACLSTNTTNCQSLTCRTVACGPLNNLAPGRQYVVSATAKLTNGQTAKASAPLLLSMPPAAAPVLLVATPAGFRRGKASALPPATGPCSTYFWLFAPVAGGARINATTTTLTVTTGMVPSGVYDVKVACVRNAKAAAPSRSLLQLNLGPFSNSLRILMPALGAPFLQVEPTGATTAAASLLPSPGTSPSRYELSVCVLGGTTASCRTVSCSSATSCPLSSLQAGTTFTTTAIAFQSNSSPSPSSNAVSTRQAAATLCSSGTRQHSTRHMKL